MLPLKLSDAAAHFWNNCHVFQSDNQFIVYGCQIGFDNHQLIEDARRGIASTTSRKRTNSPSRPSIKSPDPSAFSEKAEAISLRMTDTSSRSRFKAFCSARILSAIPAISDARSSKGAKEKPKASSTPLPCPYAHNACGLGYLCAQ